MENVRFISYDVYCERALAKLTTQMERFETLTNEGKLSTQQFLDVAAGFKSRFEFEKTRSFYNFLVVRQHPSVMATD